MISIGTSNDPLHPTGKLGGRLLGLPQRAQLALDSLQRVRTIQDLAEAAGVSRKFVYEQRRLAIKAVDEAFSSESEPDDLLGWLPVTRGWIRRAAVSAALHCHGSERGIEQHLKAITSDDLPVSDSTVHNILREAASTAKGLNEQLALDRIREGAHDEIFSQGLPILVGVHPRTMFVYLLEASGTRDEAAWYVALENKRERQGLNLVTSISDGARGLRAGVQAVFPEIEQRGDVFHAQRIVTEMVGYMEHRAYRHLAAQEHRERKMQKAKKRAQGKIHSRALGHLRQAAGHAIAVSDDVATLGGWIAELLELVGPALPERRELWDWLIAQLEARAAAAPHRIQPVVTYLKNHRDELLAFVAPLTQGLARIAESLAVPRDLIDAVYHQFALSPEDPRFEAIERRLWDEAPDKAVAIEEAVLALLEETLRASSAVENINSILRTYFFLRRSVGPAFLDLLQFYVNHRRFQRSGHPERLGKSPRELLTGQPHEDWLDLLGYPRVVLSN